jgi:Second Messenger Oligonucleotide or Dinucleotide Synthetase domain
MFDSEANPVSQLLGGAVESLDIPEELFRAAATEYADVGSWLADHADGDDGWEIYPQGSFLLGTVVRPLGRDEYDIDLVCRRKLDKSEVSQAELKAGVGEALAAYLDSRHGDSGAPDACKDRKRCFTLTYAKAFHLDVLPAIPDTEWPPTGILLTDRDLHEWQHSDPKAYAEWFKQQMATEFISKRARLAEAARIEPEQIPDSEVKTTLQRTVQALKHHRNLYFAEDLDSRPVSILVTTLAAYAYSGKQDLFDALLGAATGMPNHISRDGSGWSVTNPVQERENFADKWRDHPERAERFFAWLQQLEVDLLAANEERRLDRVASRLVEGFGRSPIEKAVKGLGEDTLATRKRGELGVDRASGALTAVGAGATKVRRHDFYGS